MASEIEAQVVTVERVLDMIEQAQSLEEIGYIAKIISNLPNEEKAEARKANNLKYVTLWLKNKQQEK